jgi:CheY-like chemotaxis protein
MEEDRSVNVLLVEDDDLTVANVKRAFDLNGHANPLYTAASGAEALEMLRGDSQNNFPEERRVVLMGLKMPEMDGLDLLREIRKDPQLRRTTVVVMTASHDERDKVQAYDLNVAGYIIKPITMVSFVQLMSAVKRYWSLNELP